MKYDVIVIGGGMSAIMCGIALATNGKNVALMVKGPSKLNYSSGSIDLLGFDEQLMLSELEEGGAAALPEEQGRAEPDAVLQESED